MEIPKINREEVDFTTDSEICNVGFYEGEKDNRPFRIEVWSSYGIDVATFFISTVNLKEEDVKAFINSTPDRPGPSAPSLWRAGFPARPSCSWIPPRSRPSAGRRSSSRWRPPGARCAAACHWRRFPSRCGGF